MAMGFVNAHRGSLDHCLNSGMSVALVPGGAREALHAHPGRADLVLACRKGFVKLALAHGARLVPVFCFGENELFQQAPSPAWLQGALVRVLGFSVPLAYGRGCCSRRAAGPLPRRVPLTMVVGAPLAMPVIADPTAAQVDAHHARYVAALRALYDAHAPRWCPPPQPLDAAAGAAAQAPPGCGASGGAGGASAPPPLLTVVQ
jgi:1-acyl-sn-glycerol-3-phosphate acyltransferase